jgi:hypothetical protein
MTGLVPPALSFSACSRLEGRGEDNRVRPAWRLARVTLRTRPSTFERSGQLDAQNTSSGSELAQLCVAAEFVHAVCGWPAC